MYRSVPHPGFADVPNKLNVILFVNNGQQQVMKGDEAFVTTTTWWSPPVTAAMLCYVGLRHYKATLLHFDLGSYNGYDELQLWPFQLWQTIIQGANYTATSATLTT